MLGANALLVLPAESAVIPAGESVDTILLDMPLAGEPNRTA
jgi:hypothetical protein